MARITVGYTGLVNGQFPTVCCKTGVQTDSYVTWRFVETPSWTWVLLPFGFLPFVIARFATTKEFQGILPISPAAEGRLRRLGRIAMVSFVGGIAAVIVGLFSVGGVAYVGFALLAVSAFCFAIGLAVTPDAKRDLDRGSVEIRNVHRTFVQTIEDSWAQNEQQN